VKIVPGLIEKIIAPAWAMYERSPYLAVCSELDSRQFISLDERMAHQWEKLRSIVKHAWEQCKFYRDRFTVAGFNPEDLRTPDDLKTIPILSKNDVREHGKEMLALSAAADLVPRKTSGSTGVSLNFFVGEAEYQFKRGAALFRDRWTGWRMGEWRAMVWGNPVYLNSFPGRLRNFLLERTFSLDTLKMDESMMKAFVQAIFRRKPTLLFGHAHSLYLFAKFWEKEGFPLYKFKGILSTAMVLHGHERGKCEQVFGSPVFDRYGCEEVSLIASECEAHEGLHVNTDSLYIELITEDGPATAPGEEGKVIVTDLCNFSMPFIRYEVGDLAVTLDKKCSCGRSYPLLSKVTGRVADYLTTPEGKLISGISLTENFATLIPGIKQIQIVQEQKDQLTLRIVPSSQFGDNSRTQIASLMLERFGSSMKYRIQFAERILPEKSGKYRFSINKVNGENSINY
jgi:phenylacetate-CoA ligase